MNFDNLVDGTKNNKETKTLEILSYKTTTIKIAQRKTKELRKHY